MSSVKNNIKLQSEKELLARVLYDPSNCYLIFDKIQLKYFVYSEIFEAIRALREPTPEKVYWEVQKQNQALATEIMQLSSTISSDLRFLIKKFLDISFSIELDKLLTDELSNNKNKFCGLDGIIDHKGKVEAIFGEIPKFERTISFEDSLTDILERLESKSKSDTAIKTTNFPSFNSATGGLNPGNLVAIAGYLKNGKTTFALNLINDLAAQFYPTAFFSLEMKKSEVEDKLIAIRTNIPHSKIRNPKYLNNDERVILSRYAAEKKKNEQLFIFDKVASWSEIVSRARELKRNYEIKIFCIDYLGLIKSSVGVESRERELSRLSGELKLLAKELDVVIIILSQLNRKGFEDASAVNLAESLGLARDCDFLFTIFNPSLAGHETVRVGRNVAPIAINENNFILKLDTSRHTPAGGKILLELDHSGAMIEKASRYEQDIRIPNSLVEADNVFMRN